MSEYKESIALAGINADGMSVVLTKEDDQLDLTQVGNLFLGFLHGMGYIYVEEVIFDCGQYTHGSNY
jgi:hypothetical protein